MAFVYQQFTQSSRGPEMKWIRHYVPFNGFGHCGRRSTLTVRRPFLFWEYFGVCNDYHISICGYNDKMLRWFPATNNLWYETLSTSFSLSMVVDHLAFSFTMDLKVTRVPLWRAGQATLGVRCLKDWPSNPGLQMQPSNCNSKSPSSQTPLSSCQLSND